MTWSDFQRQVSMERECLVENSCSVEERLMTVRIDGPIAGEELTLGEVEKRSMEGRNSSRLMKSARRKVLTESEQFSGPQIAALLL